MKRNLDLIRDILLKVEKQPDENGLSLSEFVTDTYEAKDVSIHIKMLLDVGYVEAKCFRYAGHDYDDFRVKRITMQGYDYLDSVRDEAVWAETKSLISSKVTSASLEIVKAVAATIITKMLGI